MEPREVWAIGVVGPEEMGGANRGLGHWSGRARRNGWSQERFGPLEW